MTGIVDSLSEKKHAQRILEDAAGGKEIDLAISISTDGAIDDEDVQMEVGEELAMDPKLKGKVGVKSIKGVAHLMGNVESKELKKIATKTASKARGVTEVVNEIKVGDNKEEDLFHTQVRNDDDG